LQSSGALELSTEREHVIAAPAANPDDGNSAIEVIFQVRQRCGVTLW
jgi:hypothetical protein